MRDINFGQEEAIKSVKGPILIIAGPGSGKTYTLVERVVYMVAELGIDPSQLLISTFTNKAARELLDRLSLKFKEKNISKDVNDMFLGNFHSICRRILDEYIDFLDFKRGYRLIDDVEKRYLIYRNLSGFQRISGYYDLIKSNDLKHIEEIITFIFEEGILERKSQKKDIQTSLDIVSYYENILANMNVLDYSGQLFYTYKLLQENPQVQKELKSRINYIMIDEYQDTNKVQEKIVYSLLNDEENICVVGDDDQGLYRFRGATVKNIINFGNQLKNKPKLINLSINYRSTEDIINFYSGFMGQLNSLEGIEKYRFKKKLKSVEEDNSRSVFKIQASDEEDFRGQIIGTVKKLRDQGLINAYNELAILVSSVNDSRITKLSSSLKQEGIGVYTPKTTNLLKRDESAYFFGALFAIFYPYMEKNKIRIRHDSYQFLAQAHSRFFERSKSDKKTNEFIGKMVEYIKGEGVSVTILDIIYRLLAYQPFARIMGGKRSEKTRKNISRLMELLESFSFIEQIYLITDKNLESFCNLFFDRFIGFIKEERVSEFEEDTALPEEDQLSILTIHASKGMEYSVVIVASLWEEIYSYRPNPNDYIKDLLADEFEKQVFEPREFIGKLDYYRKYYTAFSRAKNVLILAGIYSSSNKMLGKEIRPVFEKLAPISAIDSNMIRKSKKADIKTKEFYSYTQDLLQYRSCPRAYYFFRKLRFLRDKNPGMTYGSLVHESLELINKALKDGKLPNMEDVLANLRFLAIQKYRSGAHFIREGMLESAGQEVEKYCDFISEYEEVLGAEVTISVAKEDYLLTGNVDMVYTKDGKLNIIDFKTGRNPKELSNQNLLDQYIGQLKLYAYLYEETKQKKVDRISLYFTSLDNEESHLVYDANFDKEEMLKDLQKTIKEIESDESYEKTDDEWKCQGCPLVFYCGRFKA